MRGEEKTMNAPNGNDQETLGSAGDEFDFTDMLMEDAIQSKETIFRIPDGLSPAGRTVLSPSYRPTQPRHRERQIKQLIDFLRPCFTNEAPANLLIYGKTGTGKTLITKHVTSKLVQKSRDAEYIAPFVTYINVQMHNTKYRILAKICNDLGMNIPKTGLATDVVLEKLKTELMRANRILIVIIDEVDLLVKSREKDDLLYVLTRVSEDEPSVRISIIGISNDIRFKSFLGMRVLSSLNAQEIVFPPYQKSELEAILKERADLAFKDGVIEDLMISQVANIAADEHGDARKAIALLLKVGEIAEQSGSPFIDAEHVIQAKDKLEFDTTCEFLVSLPIQYQIIIIGISNAYYHYKCSVNSGTLLRIYHELVDNSGKYISRIGLRRLLQILKDLRDHGLIDLTVISNGKGRSSVASICVDRKTIERIYSKNPDLKKMLNFIPKMKCLDSFLH